MAKEPSAESAARAARLREQIDKLTQRHPNDDAETPKHPLSPREFIHKRMDELDKGKKDD